MVSQNNQVLIVDNEEEERALASVLERAGYLQPLEALELLKSEEFAILWLRAP
jgi:hypothetical protein